MRRPTGQISAPSWSPVEDHEGSPRAPLLIHTIVFAQRADVDITIARGASLRRARRQRQHAPVRPNENRGPAASRAYGQVRVWRRGWAPRTSAPMRATVVARARRAGGSARTRPPRLANNTRPRRQNHEKKARRHAAARYGGFAVVGAGALLEESAAQRRGRFRSCWGAHARGRAGQAAQNIRAGSAPAPPLIRHRQAAAARKGARGKESGQGSATCNAAVGGRHAARQPGRPANHVIVEAEQTMTRTSANNETTATRHRRTTWPAPKPRIFCMIGIVTSSVLTGTVSSLKSNNFCLG